MKKLDEMMDKAKNSDEKINEFGNLLEKMSDLDEKKKILWKEIYENALSDRERASVLFTEGFKSMSGGSADHIALGSTLVKYLERMCKSNDQIMNLADMVIKAEMQEQKIDSDDLFSRISDE